MCEVGLILNPSAGNGQLKENIDLITDKLTTKFESVNVYITSRPGDGAKYIRQISSEVDLIIGAGGDGTIYELINAICKLNERPKFAIIPGELVMIFQELLVCHRILFKLSIRFWRVKKKK
ncbi:MULTISPECIES: acylglycerol kinase family protein [unclassified Bacillus (in: firmicutes)]|uniref:acylglycerol kinase family protein n=1 Tax=unclassified Bacillus (in: firmicutes) TaxID=185979 RepID=UPI002035C913|nr:MULTISPECIES: acylglycerol kinase family protein [unclassified Bacillus (in: firmicutes)]